MNCSANTLLKVAAGLGLTLVAAYLAFPAAQTMLLASAPYLLLLICPISMGVMVLMMWSPEQRARNKSAGASVGVSRQSSEPLVNAPSKM